MPAAIEFSPHSLLKIEILRSHGIEVSKEIVENVVRAPDRMDKGYKNRLIAQKGFSDTHVLRVVYESSPDNYVCDNPLSGKEVQI